MDYKYYRKFLREIFIKRRQISTDYTESIFDVNYEKLYGLGKRLAIFDMDDTLTDYLGILSNKTISLLEGLKSQGYNVAVFSNSKPARTKQLQQILGDISVYNVTRSDKPSPHGYQEIMKHFKVKPEDSIMVGDRLGTDIYGAFLAEITTRVLIKPYSYRFGGKKTKLFDQIIRAVEKSLIN